MPIWPEKTKISKFKILPKIQFSTFLKFDFMVTLVVLKRIFVQKNKALSPKTTEKMGKKLRKLSILAFQLWGCVKFD